MSWQEKAFDVLERAIGRAMIINRYKSWSGHPGKPGAVIEDMSEEDRKKLSELKSDDVANIRKDAIY